MGATVTMSTKELDRARTIAQVVEGRLTQVSAASRLSLSDRHVRRLVETFVRDGPVGLASRHRGRRSNRRSPDELRTRALLLIRDCYRDFGPTLAREKLGELHGVSVSVETLRKWMIEDGLWTPRRARLRAVHRPRLRRACRGELIQIDGSEHAWFEGRAPRCTLLVFVDDATSELMELRFAPTESTFEYFTSVRRYLGHHGRPVAFYSDKASIFRVNREGHGGDGLTQFGRAMQDLNIDVMCANSAAAKGRVERAHKTMQDRLVKELRLAGVSSMAEGNQFLDGFKADYNRRFRKSPQSSHDAHRPLQALEPLADVFRCQVDRKVSGALTLHYKRVMYLLDDSEVARRARGNQVRIFEAEDGTVSIRFDGQDLPAHAFPKHGGAGGVGVAAGDIVANKLLAGALTHAREQQQLRDEERFAKARYRRERVLIRASANG
jgi:hypothetical protein